MDTDLALMNQPVGRGNYHARPRPGLSYCCNGPYAPADRMGVEYTCSHVGLPCPVGEHYVNRAPATLSSPIAQSRMQPRIHIAR